MTLKPIKNENIKDIESGLYREYYLIYNRKSTDEPDNQKNSIKYQKSENARFAFRERLPIAHISIEGFCTDGIISEKHSAFKENTDLVFGTNGLIQYRIERPKFYQLINFLHRGYFKGVIVLCWDRISRNKGDESIISKLMKTGVDFRFVLATYDKTSSGALHMDIDGMFAEHHSRVTSEKVSLSIRNLRGKGICTYRAPVGYLNNGKMDEKPFDPQRASIIRQLFEKYATGKWTLAELARWACKQGFTMPPIRRRKTKEEKLREEEDDIQINIKPIERIPTFIAIHQILSNPFYTGKIKGNDGVYVKSQSHQALISEELFNQVQNELKRKKVSVRYIERLHHPMRGYIRCELCRRVYTPYVKKGNIYFGARCIRDCKNTNKSFNIDFIIAKIGELMKRLSFTDEELININAQASTDIALLEMKRHRELEGNERRKKKIREDLMFLRGNKLNLLKTGVYTPEGFLEEESKLNKQLEKLQATEQISDTAMHETIKEVIKLSELLKKLYFQYEFANPYEKEAIITFIFSELTFFGKQLKYKCKKGFGTLESRFVALGGLNDWLSDLPHRTGAIQDSIHDVEKYLNNQFPP